MNEYKIKGIIVTARSEREAVKMAQRIIAQNRQLKRG